VSAVLETGRDHRTKESCAITVQDIPQIDSCQRASDGHDELQRSTIISEDHLPLRMLAIPKLKLQPPSVVVPKSVRLLIFTERRLL
jgi:hypothetical protein